MRIIWSLLLLPFVYFSSGVSEAFADVQWQDKIGGLHSAPASACLASKTALHQGTFRSDNMGIVKDFNRWRATCSWTHGTGSAFNIWTTGSCDSGKTFNLTTGTCKFEDPLNCAAKAGQSTNWRAEYDSLEAYDQNPIRCTTSQGGCAVDVCESGTHECQVEGRTGKFVCVGKGGKYTGDPQAATTGPSVDGCEGLACESKPPQESSSDKNCTPPTTTNGVTTHTCVSESNTNQFADSNCAVGSVNGVQGLHCTSPDYVPESNDKTKTDKITESNNPDGGKTTTTESKTDQTKCKAGNCSSSSTTTNTTTTTNGNGQTTGESSTCSGDRCDDPSTPGRDESEEEPEEEDEPVERTASGDACSASLSCEGDAIDCAILRQQKAMRCSLDWDTQKGAVIAEAGRSEYQLQTDEIDASSLFSGPSAGRWLSASCPADRSIYLTLTDSSITFSWSFVCQYASALGNLLVALSSLFFAVYVGRAFGGD